jgi:hypothetical protein
MPVSGDSSQEESDSPNRGLSEQLARVSEQLATVVAALDSERQAQWAAIAEVAALVIVGFLAAVAAAVILFVDNDANQWWWLGVGLAAALTFIRRLASSRWCVGTGQPRSVATVSIEPSCGWTQPC